MKFNEILISRYPSSRIQAQQLFVFYVNKRSNKQKKNVAYFFCYRKTYIYMFFNLNAESSLMLSFFYLVFPFHASYVYFSFYSLCVQSSLRKSITKQWMKQISNIEKHSIKAVHGIYTKKKMNGNTPLELFSICSKALKRRQNHGTWIRLSGFMIHTWNIDIYALPRMRLCQQYQHINQQNYILTNVFSNKRRKYT